MNGPDAGASVDVMAFMNLDSAVMVAALTPASGRLVLLVTHALRLRVGALHLSLRSAEKSRECNAGPLSRLGWGHEYANTSKGSLHNIEYFLIDKCFANIKTPKMHALAD
jgi:hypothetical protein